MRQHEWVKKERWVGMGCSRRDLTGLTARLDGLTSIRGDVDVRGTVKIVSFTTTKRTTTLADTVFVHSPHELCRLSRNSNSISASSSDIRRVRSRTSSLQCLDQSSSRFALRIRPSSKRSERGVIGNAMVLPIPSTSFPTKSYPSPRVVDVPIPIP